MAIELSLVSFLFNAVKTGASTLTSARPDLSGQWYFEVKYARTENNPFRNMRVQYLAQLLQDGSGKITGTAEKILDIESNGNKRPYVGQWRVQVRLNGHMRFSLRTLSWRVNFHIEEQGHIRPSSTTHQLRLRAPWTDMLGKFNSTISNASGPSHWRRDPFLNM